jgi:sulfatase modifying factor 1
VNVVKWRGCWIVLCVVLALSGCMGNIEVDEKGPIISGMVYDDEGHLFAGDVIVSLNGESTIFSNSEFVLRGFAPGRKELRVEANGYKTYTKNFAIYAEEHLDYVVYLVKENGYPLDSPSLIDEVLVPGADRFPIGTKDDSYSSEVNYPFYMAKYEVTYKLWRQVYDWATSEARGTGRYYFQNVGSLGSVRVESSPIIKNNLHPVTDVSWRDAIVWCNALTEFYNYLGHGTLECVYTYGGEVIRDSRDSNSLACNRAVAGQTNGYRLPTSLEWELAARYQDGEEWTPGKHVSGDLSGHCDPYDFSSAFSWLIGDYAWYDENSFSSTHPVGEKLPNHLGIYDMGGNVSEWCYDTPPNRSLYRLNRGGSFSLGPLHLQLARTLEDSTGDISASRGFRPVRTK